MGNKEKNTPFIEQVREKGRAKASPRMTKDAKSFSEEVYSLGHLEDSLESKKRKFESPVLPNPQDIGKNLPYGLSYTARQKNSIMEGYKKRVSLLKASSEAASKALSGDEIRGDFKPDTILSGSTGIGKSYNTKRAFDMVGIEPRIIRGNVTMFQFGANLMLEHYRFSIKRKSQEERLVIVLDDCDSFFSNKDSLNILKGMSGERGSRIFQYNKAIPTHMLTEVQLEILQNYSNPDGSMGFSVNCDDIVFILNTNFKLPTENQANNFMKENGPTPKANRLQDLAAIRRRFTCRDFILDMDTNWGWIAYVSLYDGLLDSLGNTQESEFRKYQILNFIWSNWERMTEHNLDTVTDMRIKMMQDPNNYNNNWEVEFIEDTNSKSA